MDVSKRLLCVEQALSEVKFLVRKSLRSELETESSLMRVICPAISYSCLGGGSKSCTGQVQVAAEVA